MLSTKEAQRHMPEWRKGEGDSAPVYLIRPGSVIERAMVEAELAGEHGAGRVFSFEVLAAFKAGIAALTEAGPDRDQLLSLAASEAGGEALSAEEARLIAEARGVLAEHWPDYRVLTLRMARRKEVAPIVSLRRFCVGWENVEAAFERGADGLLTYDAIGKLEPFEMMSAGNFAFSLLFPGELEGNSQQPSPSDDGLPTSSSDEPSPAAGKSRAKGGRKTRA